MSKITKQNIRPLLTLFFLTVFLCSLLIKPAHTLLAHHQHSISINNDHTEKISINHYKNCPICDFEFYTFIQQKQINIPKAKVLVFSKLVLPTVACLASISSHLFQLRAPPTYL